MWVCIQEADAVGSHFAGILRYIATPFLKNTKKHVGHQ
jgi:hypothetical protein